MIIESFKMCFSVCIQSIKLCNWSCTSSVRYHMVSKHGSSARRFPLLFSLSVVECFSFGTFCLCQTVMQMEKGSMKPPGFE